MERKKVIIVGGGKSIREEWLNNGLFDNLKDSAEIWVLNFAYLTIPYLPNRFIWTDGSFYRTNHRDIFELYKLGVQIRTTTNGVNVAIASNYPDEIEMIRDESKFKTLDSDTYWERAMVQKRVFKGSQSLVGVFALHMAILEEFKQIYLLGYDFGTSLVGDPDTHYYSTHFKFDKEIHKGVGELKAYREPDGRCKSHLFDFAHFLEWKDNIYNVINPQHLSNVDYFKKITYEEMYEKLD